MPNVVLLCGTSGSGKTYIAEQVIGRTDQCAAEADVAAGEPRTGERYLRGKVSGYWWTTPPVAIAGRYEAACGGCDALSWRGASDDLEEQVRLEVSQGRSVLVEGLIVASWGLERLLRLDAAAQGSEGRLRVVHLTTPLEVCLASVNARRAERARARRREPTEVDPANTTAKWRGFRDGMQRRRDAGLDVHELDRDAALAATLGWLGLDA